MAKQTRYESEYWDKWADGEIDRWKTECTSSIWSKYKEPHMVKMDHMRLMARLVDSTEAKAKWARGSACCDPKKGGGPRLECTHMNCVARRRQLAGVRLVGTPDLIRTTAHTHTHTHTPSIAHSTSLTPGPYPIITQYRSLPTTTSDPPNTIYACQSTHKTRTSVPLIRIKAKHES